MQTEFQLFGRSVLLHTMATVFKFILMAITKYKKGTKSAAF